MRFMSFLNHLFKTKCKFYCIWKLTQKYIFPSNCKSKQSKYSKNVVSLLQTCTKIVVNFWQTWRITTSLQLIYRMFILHPTTIINTNLTIGLAPSISALLFMSAIHLISFLFYFIHIITCDQLWYMKTVIFLFLCIFFVLYYLMLNVIVIAQNFMFVQEDLLRLFLHILTTVAY
jgi:hypothetical protein